MTHVKKIFKQDYLHFALIAVAIFSFSFFAVGYSFGHVPADVVVSTLVRVVI